MKYLPSALFVFLPACAFAVVTSSCSSGGGSGASSSISADKPSTAMAAVSAAVAVVGSSMGAASVSSSFVGPNRARSADITQDCSVNAQPLRSGVAVSQSDPDYPGKFIYCKLAFNTEDEESIQGAFAQVKSISCMLEHAGLVFDGSPHTFTVTVDSTCWSALQMSHMGGGGMSMNITATGSSPAAFNSYYARGISMNIPSVGGFQLATNVSATKVEFMETDAVPANNKSGGFAASLDYATGDLNYELRADRYNDTVDGNSGGFGRHQRIYAKVTTAGQEVTGLTSVSAAQAEVYNGAVMGGYGGQISTATGSLASGLKARFWASSNGLSGAATGTSDLSNPSKWHEVPNTRCYTNTSSAGTGCTAGIAIPTTNAVDSFPFALVGTGFTDSVVWGTAHGASTFTVVDPAVDVQ